MHESGLFRRHWHPGLKGLKAGAASLAMSGAEIQPLAGPVPNNIVEKVRAEVTARREARK